MGNSGFQRSLSTSPTSAFNVWAMSGASLTSATSHPREYGRSLDIRTASWSVLASAACGTGAKTLQTYIWKQTGPFDHLRRHQVGLEAMVRQSSATGLADNLIACLFAAPHARTRRCKNVVHTQSGNEQSPSGDGMMYLSSGIWANPISECSTASVNVVFPAAGILVTRIVTTAIVFDA